jgi:antitoxin (DNA-binding transcriptional repressor) of toxin-antitoxin stability system
VREVSATDAARGFSDVLDAVEHANETFVVTRSGRTIALITPAPAARGRAVKTILRRHRPDRAWISELRELRGLVDTEDRPWPG